ncbi:MAG: hypothetical protein IJE19_10470 [Clostridia bacterium]|nr:hypothetical protein [Clostridia bacterium]
MQVILIKVIFLIMPAVVFLSGMFPFLFDGKEYINPEGDRVTVIEHEVSKDGVIVNDCETLKSFGDIGLNYEKDFFENNSLAVVTVEYQQGDEFYIKSIYKEGSSLKVEYIIVDKSIAAIYMPAYETIIIETDKTVENIGAKENDAIDNLNLTLIEWYRKISGIALY